jgi:hypothetical protein
MMLYPVSKGSNKGDGDDKAAGEKLTDLSSNGYYGTGGSGAVKVAETALEPE